MELNTRMEVHRRSGCERRKHGDPHYRGPERRSGLDRRSAKLGIGPVCLEPTVGAHRLVPINGNHFLSPLVVGMRLASEFAYVEADEAGGLRHVMELMRQLEAKKSHGRNSLRDERLEHLDKVKDRAVYLCFGEDPGCATGYLCTVVIPGEPLIFEYESPAHERAVQPLLRRCAQVLGYDIRDGVADVAGSHLSLGTEQRRSSGLC